MLLVSSDGGENREVLMVVDDEDERAKTARRATPTQTTMATRAAITKLVVGRMVGLTRVLYLFNQTPVVTP